MSEAKQSLEDREFQFELGKRLAKQHGEQWIQESLDRRLKEESETITIPISGKERKILEQESRKKGLPITEILRQKIWYESNESELDRRLVAVENEIALLKRQ
ncbi:MAG: hypothetical protein LBQ50_05745 [Planctomycetaceae bacterium]|nr:hypothetical protein [Planctomycetaceae bacterium]